MNDSKQHWISGCAPPTSPEEKRGHTNTASDWLLICLKQPIQTGSSTERENLVSKAVAMARAVLFRRGDQDAADDSADFQHTQLHRGARL